MLTRVLLLLALCPAVADAQTFYEDYQQAADSSLPSVVQLRQPTAVYALHVLRDGMPLHCCGSSPTLITRFDEWPCDLAPSSTPPAALNPTALEMPDPARDGRVCRLDIRGWLRSLPSGTNYVLAMHGLWDDGANRSLIDPWHWSPSNRAGLPPDIHVLYPLPPFAIQWDGDDEPEDALLPVTRIRVRVSAG